MKWFFTIFYVVTAILFLSFIAWIVTRVLHADGANYVVGRIMIYDLYAIGVVLAYSAFVGGWHLWEKLTGRMEPERETEGGSSTRQP
jgi:type VI protein secretion system component VasK